MKELKVYVTTEEITEEERKSMPKLIGIDLEYMIERWFDEESRSLMEFITGEIIRGR